MKRRIFCGSGVDTVGRLADDDGRYELEESFQLASKGASPCERPGSHRWIPAKVQPLFQADSPMAAWPFYGGIP